MGKEKGRNGIMPWEVVFLTTSALLGTIAPSIFGVERLTLVGVTLSLAPLALASIITLVLAGRD